MRRFAVLAGLWALCLAPAAAATTTLKISTIVPAGTSFMQQMRAAGEAVRERTEGRVELKFFPGGVMGSDPAVLRKMRIGQLHGAVITATGLNNIHPATQAYSMPFTFRNHEELQFVRQRLDPVIRERVRKRGYVVAGMAEGGFTYLFSKQPLRRMEDLSDARMWAPQGDDITARLLEDAGAQVVSLPLSDVYTSLQTGVLDTVTVNPSGMIGLQWHTGVNYQTDVPLLMLMAMMVIDERALAPLDEADRTALLNVMDETFRGLDEMNRQADREAQEALREAGIELVEPSRPPGERRWQASAERSLDKLASEGRFRDALYDRVKSLVSEYRSRTAAQ
ncbi:MAG: TRAP transporter substrate-binding protein DctP [Halofilum sp. (in: g-proteobacteria)]|nr:TRAP transporter substrate-binding protein DctP [Halofilum sp. (in: g-proteobacteria)]